MGAQSSRLSAPAQAVPDKELSPLTVLVVDDEPAVCRLLAEMLHATGHRILTAGSAEEALGCLRTHQIAVLIVDVQLVGIDGITFLEQALEADGRLLGIVMTGYGNIELAVRAMKAGAADFLTKPLQLDLVHATVSRLLELYRLRRENSLLKSTLIRSGNLRLRAVSLTDFGRGNRTVGSDDATEFERGVVEGEKRADERTAAIRQKEQALTASLMAQLEETSRSLHETVEEEIASLAFMIAQKVVRDLSAANHEVVVAQTRSALAHLHESGLVRIHVHPSDLPFLETSRAALSQTPHGLLSLKFETDPDISPGGCLVQAANLSIDATLDSQLLRLGEALRKREGGEA
ncbi:MAG: Flagellar assembly protein FliH [Nitrospira sp.]|jgi:FixJ family two-component response regulator/flagellar biosynthesis/type III secretory pathway protein FliH|nr:MAG: Flagellar assembly protein FliH [Nitrospira sp.]